MKETSEGRANLSIETLKQMGYNYPCTARRIIEAVEQGEDPKGLNSGLIKSLLTAEGHGHVFHSFILEYTKTHPEEKPLCQKNKDRILLIDRKWVPSKNRRILGKIVEFIRNGKTVEEALEVLKEEEAEEQAKPEKEAPCDLQCAVSFCKSIFEEKCALYGLSFIEMHIETLTDQLFMKATILKKRLTERNKGKRFESYFFEDVRNEFAAVVNYGVIALRQGGFGVQSLVPDAPIKFYTDQMKAALSLICDKSADYGHLWREQRIGTFSDMIYTKVRRLKSIENQYRVGGMTEEKYRKVVGDQYKDLINYGLFGVVRMTEIADVMTFEMEEDETEGEGYE